MELDSKKLLSIIFSVVFNVGLIVFAVQAMEIMPYFAALFGTAFASLIGYYFTKQPPVPVSDEGSKLSINLDIRGILAIIYFVCTAVGAIVTGLTGGLGVMSPYLAVSGVHTGVIFGFYFQTV